MSAIIRRQRTLGRETSVTGFGFFGGIDATVRFLPADEDHGIVFQRTDLHGRPTVPATIDYVQASPRRTRIADGDASVELVEHVMSALAGLQIDNVLIEIDGPEVPGCDGSARAFCDALLDAEPCEQTRPVRTAAAAVPWSSIDQAAGCEIGVRPHIRRMQAVTYQLDYGHRSPIPAQLLSIELTPEVYLRDIAWARTFVLESEVKALRQSGHGTRVTEKDLLVFGNDGLIGNSLRAIDECVRHKVLDCIGDFALFGGEIHGHFDAWRSGHRHNHDVIRNVRQYTVGCESGLTAA